ncbi:MAG: tetratricopeptide repeat protein [Balneolaceae bacterium]
MKIYKLFLPIIVLSGLLWACETTDPFVNEVTLDIFTGEYESALETADAAIAVNSENYIAHYYKGVVLTAWAESLPVPADRKEYYERAKASFDTAKGLMEQQEETPAELQELNDTVVAYWADEYNAGVDIQTDDSLFSATPDPYRTSLYYFENAAAINPDSAMTYQVMSSTYFQMNDVENAINAYEQAMALLDPPLIDDYEFLISLYLYENRYEEAISYSQEALELYPDETSFVQFLADAYIQSGERDIAIELIEELIADEPDNPQYRRVLGTQIYQSVDGLTEEVTELYRTVFDLSMDARGMSGSELADVNDRIADMRQQITEMEAEIDEYTEIALRELNRVVELEPESESANFILAIIYQNRAASYFERRNNVTDDDFLVEEYDRLARENLEQARVYYEKAAEINPENPENWRSLFQVYTQLGMEEEAQDAMEKADFEE